MAKKDRKIEWVAYDGDYPILCTGKLTVKIGRKVCEFGLNEKYPKFWRSGGHCGVNDDGSEFVEPGDWWFNWSDYERFCGNCGYGTFTLTEGERRKLEKLFQEKVPKGCCGGCI